MAALVLALIAGAATHAGARPLRVMSISNCGDQLVLALLPPERIASVTWDARDPTLSGMLPEARRVAINHGLAENVLRDRPDLVIAAAGPYAVSSTRAMLKTLHIPLLELEEANSFDDIRRQTRQVAAAVGAEARGEALLAAMDADLRRLAAGGGRPVRVAAWDGAGFGAQPGTLYDALLRAAGARNVAAEGAGLGASPGVERLLALHPDLLVEGAPGSEPPGLRTAVLDNPVVRRLWGARTVRLPAPAYVCGTPFSAGAALKLQAEMRKALAKTPGPLPAWSAR